MSPTQERKEILRRFMEDVWNQGRLDAVDAYLALRYTVRHDPGDPWHGKQLDAEAFKERLRVSRAPFPDQRFEIQELFADGDAVVATWLWTGTHRAELAGFPATGRQIRMSGATVYYFEGLKICGHWQIVDRLSVFQQLSADRQPG
ncbi:MAG TPA: ester cyclase [Nevskia sp.]|nr:ester cyclase [Nevskia sp.]